MPEVALGLSVVCSSASAARKRAKAGNQSRGGKIPTAKQGSNTAMQCENGNSLSNTEGPCHWDTLPVELRAKVLEQCDFQDKISASLVSKAWSELLKFPEVRTPGCLGVQDAPHRTDMGCFVTRSRF